MIRPRTGAALAPVPSAAERLDAACARYAAAMEAVAAAEAALDAAVAEGEAALEDRDAALARVLETAQGRAAAAVAARGRRAA